MKKLIRIVLKIFKIIFIALLSIILIIVLSVPISKFDFTDSTEVGQHFKKVAFTNVNILPLDSSYVLNNKTIIVENGEILHIQESVLPLAQDIKTINAKGKYLMPGLTDMHAHIFDRSDLALYLGYGVTSVRNMMGFPMHLKWKNQIENGVYEGSDLITATPTINSGNNAGPFHKYVNTESEIIEALNDYANKGYDFVKIYDGLTENQFSTVMNEAGNLNLKVAGHPPYAVNLDDLLDSKMVSLEHIEEVFQSESLLDFKFDTIKARKMAKKISQKDIYVTITLSAYHNIFLTVVEKDKFLNSIPKEFINPLLQFIGDKQLSGWKNTSSKTYDWTVKKYKFMEKLVKIFHEENVKLLLGTDTGPNLTVPGLTLHDEIQLLKVCGIPAIDIIRSGTVNANRALGLSQKGLIKEGYKADFILLDENPLNNLSGLRNPTGIFKSEKYYDSESIKKLKENGKNHSGIYITLGRFLEHLFSK